MTHQTKKTEEFVIPEKISTFEDKRTKSKTVAFSFDFPSGSQGVMMITKRVNHAWIPVYDIKKITIEFND